MVGGLGCRGKKMVPKPPISRWWNSLDNWSPMEYHRKLLWWGAEQNTDAV